MQDSLEPLGLNLKMIQDSPASWSINKSLAFRLSFDPMISVGTFFKTLSDGDLDFLTSAYDRMTVQEDDETITETLLLSCLLAVGEGLEIVEDVNVMMDRHATLAALVAAESLYRKGLVNLKRENMSLGTDSTNLDLISITEQGRDFVNYIRKNDEGLN